MVSIEALVSPSSRRFIYSSIVCHHIPSKFHLHQNYPVRRFFLHREIQFLDEPSMVWWQTSCENVREKSDDKPLMNKLKTYLSNVLYLNMGNSNFHIWHIFEFFFRKTKFFICEIFSSEIFSHILYPLHHGARCYMQMIFQNNRKWPVVTIEKFSRNF